MTVPKCEKCDKDWYRRVHGIEYCEVHANEVEKTNRRNALFESKVRTMAIITGGLIAGFAGLIYIYQFITNYF